MIKDPIVGLAVVVGLGACCQVIAARARVPSIILLLAAGLAVGPATGWLEPDELFGSLLLPAVSAAVGILLFEGGLSLRWRDLGGERVVVVRLLTVGVVVAAPIGALAALGPGRLPLGPAALFGVIMVVTGPTVVIPLLRQARLRPRMARVLRWEGICVDPIGAVLAVVVLEIVIEQRGGVADATVAVLLTVAVGAGVGMIAAAVLVYAFRRGVIADHLRSPVVFAAVLVTLEAANAVVHEAGLVATTVLGVALANQRRVQLRAIAEFHESMTVLLIPVMFICLAARVSGPDLSRNLLPAIGVLAVLVIVARPLSVGVSTVGSRLQRGERNFLAAMAPRGIVAAAVSALFGLRLEELGIAGGADLAALTFLVVAGTVVVYGTAARQLASRLGVAAPTPTGVVLVGAEPWAAQLGAVLLAADVPVLVIACDDHDASVAAEHGLPTYASRLQSADLDLAVEAIGARLGLVTSTREESAAFAADRLGSIVGHANVHVIAFDESDRIARESDPSAHWGHVAFGGTWTRQSALDGAAHGHLAYPLLNDGRPLPDGAVALVAISESGAPTLIDGKTPSDAVNLVVFGRPQRARPALRHARHRSPEVVDDGQ